MKKGSGKRTFSLFPLPFLSFEQLHPAEKAILAAHLRVEDRLPVPQVADPDDSLEELVPGQLLITVGAGANRAKTGTLILLTLANQICERSFVFIKK